MCDRVPHLYVHVQLLFCQYLQYSSVSGQDISNASGTKNHLATISNGGAHKPLKICNTVESL